MGCVTPGLPWRLPTLAGNSFLQQLTKICQYLVNLKDHGHARYCRVLNQSQGGQPVHYLLVDGPFPVDSGATAKLPSNLPAGIVKKDYDLGIFLHVLNGGAPFPIGQRCVIEYHHCAPISGVRNPVR